MKIIEIEGIGKKYAGKLGRAGYDNVEAPKDSYHLTPFSKLIDEHRGSRFYKFVYRIFRAF